MKIRSSILITLTIILLFGINMTAQKEWSLEECINYAFENNLTIKQTILNVESANHDLLQSKLNIAPSLNASTSQNFGWGRAPDPQTNIYATQQTQRTFFNINTEVTLFNGLQQVNSVRKAQFDYLASKYDSDKIRNDISLNIAASYLSILFNIELVNNAQRQLDMSREQIERTRKQVEAGALAKGSLYDIEAQEAADEANLINAKNNLMLAYLDLMQLLDLESITDFDIDKPVLEITGTPTLLPAEMIYSKSVMIMPEIKSAEYRLESAGRTLALSQGARSPRIFASGSLGTLYSDQIRDIVSNPGEIPEYGDVKSFSNQFKDNRDGSLVFGLSIPIFNGYRVSTNIKKSKIYYENVNLELEIEKNRLRKNIETAYADALGAYKTYISNQKSVNAFTESFKYTEEKFNVGMVNSTDYNVVKIQLANAESDLASSKFNYIFKVKILDFYLGKSLTLSDIANVKEN